MRPGAAVTALLLTSALAACGGDIPTPRAETAASASEPSFYPSLLPFRKGDVGLGRTLREGRPAMILFTDDG